MKMDARRSGPLILILVGVVLIAGAFVRPSGSSILPIGTPTTFGPTTTTCVAAIGANFCPTTTTASTSTTTTVAVTTTTVGATTLAPLTTLATGSASGKPTLPVTGGPSGLLLGLGVALVAIGLGLLGASKVARYQALHRGD
jgi:hypothetical protein